MGLDKYHEKRRFGRTPEPEGKVQQSPSGRLYIIQKHAASRLHYDLRLELDGVLKSWAVPRGPSMVPAEKRLAVHVEDHPIEYGSFEGTIPRGEYGGGAVMLWDRGCWEPIGDPRTGYEKGDFKFRLFGEKIKGDFVLARMKGSAGEEGKNWLLIKKRDEHAISPGEPDPVDYMDLSVASGRSMDEIAAKHEKVWLDTGEAPGDDPRVEILSGAKKGRKRTAAKSQPLIDPSGLPGARPALQPGIFHPELATLADGPPEGDNWLHEIKYDGYRILCMISDGGVRLVSRNGNEWTARFPEIARNAQKLPVENAILDGEVVVVDPEGKTDFQALQNVLKGIETGRLFYFVFDIPYARGLDLTGAPLAERKEFLRRLLQDSPEDGSCIRYADHIRGEGGAVFVNACRLGLEGIVSKQAESPYTGKRTGRWLKIKCFHRREFVIGGFTEPGGSRRGFGALLLGYYNPDGALVYAGKAGTGFDERTLDAMAPRLTALETGSPPFINPPTGHEAGGAHWVRPTLVAEVDFSSWTREGILRHPSFKGLREDKDPREVITEKPQLSSPPPAKPRASSKTPPSGFPITSPDRVLYPDTGVTKRELAAYYSDISTWILPHIARRPLTLVRCPEGWRKECFYQKHLGGAASGALRSIPIREKDGRENYSLAENTEGLIALVQIGVLEIHVWGSREENLEKPDMMIFDLDPDPEATWEKVVSAAFVLRERLLDLGLKSFVKTTGGKGLHVAVPLTPRANWDEVKEFSRAVAEGIVRESPADYIATMSKAKRKGKIFIDYLRNGRGATSVAAYSTRAGSGAPISTPVAWDELLTDIRPNSFNINNIRNRLASLKKDPWEGYFEVRQPLTGGIGRKAGSGG